MRFGIVSDRYKDPDFKVLKHIRDLLDAKGVETVFPLNDGSVMPDAAAKTSESAWSGVDLAISVGGDGTFLHTCHQIYEKGIPLIGVNLGQMGFMTEIEAEDLEPSLELLAAGKYRLIERMMLEVEVLGPEGESKLKTFALNDAVMYRGDISRIIPCTFSLNGKMIETIPSDGIIVAGPVGSTGYALACGGPIVQPSLELMILTPISPHTLHNRSYIMNADSEVTLGIEETYPFEPMLSIDGQALMKISRNDKVIVRRAESPMKLANLAEINFFKRLPDKINARGKAR